MPLPGEVHIVDDVPGAFAQLVVDTAPRSVALSGGSTARDCYRRLRDTAFAWSGVEVFFGDDRFVPAEHSDSNEGMARAALLDHVRPGVIHGMYAPEPIAAAADRYDALVRTAPPIDLVHLGLGADGHTASLFPGSPAGAERKRFVVATADDLHPHPRLTFTFPAIARSVVAVVTVAGSEKRAAVARIRAGEDLPGAHIRAGRVVWLGDAAALG